MHQWEACRDCEGPGCPLKSTCLPTLINCKATSKPKTCAELGQQCGPANDGCGHTLDFGGCSAGSTCSGGRCSCVPKSSCNPGAQCGTQDDGCGGTLICGTCQSGSVCNKEANRCESGCGAVCEQRYLSCMDCDRSQPGGCLTPTQCADGRRGCKAACQCKPKTCAELGQQCGPANDGCGHTLDCGGCSGGSTCSGGRCVPSCVPKRTCSGGAQCGTQDDGCGDTLTCGTCPAGLVCNGNRCVSACKAICQQQYLLCLDCEGPDCPLPRECVGRRRACEAACP